MWIVVQPVVKKFRSAGEAARADREEYRRVTGEERLRMALELRRMALGDGDSAGQRLERVLTRAKLPGR